MYLESQEWRRNKAAGKPVDYYPPSLEFTVVPLVTQFAVNMYKKLRNNTLNNQGKKFTDAETNLALGELARQFKHGRVFYSERARDGRMEDYNWAVE